MSEKPSLEVCLSPALLHLFNLENTVVVVIDIFRATSTICAALDNGAKAVIPISSIDECLSFTLRSEDFITAGERDGKVIPGLQYGNSPLEYSAQFIKNKVLVLTTTNGTRLLHMAKSADRIIIGSFLNLDVVCNYLIKKGKNVLLACSAWKDRVNMEDTLLAGAITEKIKDKFKVECDSARLAQRLFVESRNHASLLDALKDSSHYRRLSGFGLQKDMEYCTTLNLHPIVPVYNGKELLPADETEFLN